MNHRKSHNDYWNSRQISLAISEQCNIIECDIIPLRNQFRLSHSWRPFLWMTYGALDKYLSFVQSWTRNNRLILQIDIKFSCPAYAPLLVLKMMEYHNESVKIILSANNRWYTGDREAVANDVCNLARSCGLNIELYSEFKKNNQIETLQLHKSEPWYKKINHF